MLLILVFLVCCNKLFNKEGIIKNVGCHPLLFIKFFLLITILIFYIKQLALIKNKIKNIAFGIIEINLLDKKKKKKRKRKKLTNNKKKCKNFFKDTITSKRTMKKKYKIRKYRRKKNIK